MCAKHAWQTLDAAGPTTILIERSVHAVLKQALRDFSLLFCTRDSMCRQRPRCDGVLHSLVLRMDGHAGWQSRLASRFTLAYFASRVKDTLHLHRVQQHPRHFVCAAMSSQEATTSRARRSRCAATRDEFVFVTSEKFQLWCEHTRFKLKRRTQALTPQRARHRPARAVRHIFDQELVSPAGPKSSTAFTVPSRRSVRMLQSLPSKPCCASASGCGAKPNCAKNSAASRSW